MQVATLFREATTLLDAGMEDGSHIKMGNFHETNNMKPDTTCDDGYETAGGGDGDIPKHHLQHHNHPHHQPIPHHPHRMPLIPSISPHMKEEVMKYEIPDDPYSFVDDDHIMSPQSTSVAQQAPKRRGRKKKLKMEDHNLDDSQVYQGLMSCLPHHVKGRGSGKAIKERKKHDRFNGMPEEEVSKRTLPDHLTQNLDIVIIGINPGLFAAYKGHHYAGPGNHFWKCLFLSGLTPEPMTAEDDYKLLKTGIGFTNMVERATKGSADLTRKEIKEGSQILLEKLQKFKPKIAVFNGKLIFEVFSGKKDFSFGRQPEMVDGTDTYMWVMPSSSARCAQLPRAADKVPFYAALKKFRDYLNGVISEIDEKEMVFSHPKLKSLFESDVKKEDDDDQSSFEVDTSRASLLDNELQKDDGASQPKKKRGRPKKIKTEGENKDLQLTTLKEELDCDKLELPKKKRGRPKKVKAMNVNEGNPALPSPSDVSNPPSHCFSPPIQSPNMQSFSMYHHNLYNQSSRSPMSSSYHPSPLQSHGYNQSPQPPSFTHSDLSSEISAAISSERTPESPAMGPPDFEPPASLSEEMNCKSNEEKDKEYHFSPPPSKKSCQNFDDFSTDSDSIARLPQKHMGQDMASKSLSGLESLVDQIPNITDCEPSLVVGGESEPLGSQYSDDSAYMSDYARSHYSPQYSTPTSNSFLQHHSNFSVTSLANSSVPDASFSVSSLAGNYQQPSYPSLMAPPVTSVIDANPPLFNGTLERSCHVDPNFNISGNTAIPYPYTQYPSYPNSGTGFYPTPHNIHMPSPNYAYPSSYTGASYPQPSYLPNHMFDRFKSDRMEFSGF